jgi:Glycosyltransferases involved in cell wall biogenesis
VQRNEQVTPLAYSSTLPKVSVVVPVYNTEPYLRQCLESIVSQTLQDIEIICVDDGSTDQSPEILKDFSRSDTRVRVLNQQNQYAGTARNLAMDAARGEYLVFWDSDDFFEPDALQKMYDQIKHHRADICVCGANQYLEASGEIRPSNRYLAEGRLPETPVFNRHTNPDTILTFTTVMVWNKMYRRAFLEEHGLKFESWRTSEDVPFSVGALLLAKSITTLPDRLINYRVGRADSLVATLDKDPLATFKAWKKVHDTYGTLPDFPEYDYFFKVISVLRHTKSHLKTVQGKAAYQQAVRGGALKQLGIAGRSPSFYLGWLAWLIRRHKS